LSPLGGDVSCRGYVV